MGCAASTVCYAAFRGLPTHDTSTAIVEAMHAPTLPGHRSRKFTATQESPDGHVDGQDGKLLRIANQSVGSYSSCSQRTANATPPEPHISGDGGSPWEDVEESIVPFGFGSEIASASSRADAASPSLLAPNGGAEPASSSCRSPSESPREEGMPQVRRNYRAATRQLSDSAGSSEMGPLRSPFSSLPGVAGTANRGLPLGSVGGDSMPPPAPSSGAHLSSAAH